MDIHVAAPSGENTLLARIAPALAACEAGAASFDRSKRPDTGSLGALSDAGALVAPFPPEFGGLGLGTIPEGGPGLARVLRRIGKASLSIGRLFEGHVNGVRLVVRYGTRAQTGRLAEDAAAGHLSAIWAAENPAAPVTLADGMLRGRKSFASGAGIVTRPVLTAHLDGREQLVLARLQPGHGAGLPVDMQGVRAAATAPVTLDGVPVTVDQLIGAPGDYMRQPEISLGAWRPLAVMLGGVDGLVEALADDIRRRGRDGDPHQRARFGRVVMLRDTIDLWVDRMADLAEGDYAGCDGEDAAAGVKLARIAVEDAVTEALRLAQRNVGMSGLVWPHPVERLSRDLSTYLRQPALDMVLDEAAAHYLSGAPA